jgi:hypothetical protein
MKAHLLSNETVLGSFHLKIMDETMGVVAGDFSPTEQYIMDFQQAFRDHLSNSNWALIESFNLSVITENGTRLNPAGGIIINDFEDFPDEFTIEVCGIDLEGMNLEYYKS